MPAPRNRSTSVKKIKRRTPTRGSAILYRRVESGKSHSCALCGGRLQAVSSQRGTKGSARTPNRMYGGNLCSACSTRVLVARNRIAEGTMQLNDVDIRMLPYVKQ